mmetsp:Transcript_9219/g.18674  ORF Transcript_9219/g.18674 Transcript_9219/m.18674 type:complete len:358 (-) Transcript_9219:65-1138(-)|eukprot:CAMPEP_0118644442 /NCGR_PEP_ID=MMETSP0785-20121206/6950_1 /TAXON_ID=91992 /ORGANISM="Bolidomonas pacifica, Strain CCMP 1866" /LENGTH=357 /DNA_ID=CAMNT_0006536219 /DNA_START=104 /DNA_END=1177 /DNA_ORIENTATION=-
MNKMLALAILCFLLLTGPVFSAAPLSLHTVAEVAVGGDATIKLLGYDTDIGHSLTATITSLPTTGKIYQLSDVYSKYGYDPKPGTEITSINTVVTDPKMRVLYVRPTPDRELSGDFARFEYTVSDGTATSSAGTVVVMGPSKNVVSSDFSSSNDGWTIEGNRVPGSPATYEASSRGSLNHYIYGTDDSLNMLNGSDKDLWYFNAPSTFLGWQGAVYGGFMEFTMSSFSGDFSAANLNSDSYLVELHCSKCAINSGVTISYPLSATSFDGSTKTFSISMKEDGGWLKDPENTLKVWSVPTKCDFIEVLSGLTHVKILGDFTKWYESVSIDNVKFTKSTAKSSIPICAQGSPDASTCTC